MRASTQDVTASWAGLALTPSRKDSKLPRCVSQDPSTSMAEKLGSLRSYRSHLRDQYTDRSILWQLCDLSYAHEGDLMVIWIDGMEQIG